MPWFLYIITLFTNLRPLNKCPVLFPSIQGVTQSDSFTSHSSAGIHVVWIWGAHGLPSSVPVEHQMSAFFWQTIFLIGQGHLGFCFCLARNFQFLFLLPSSSISQCGVFCKFSRNSLISLTSDLQEKKLKVLGQTFVASMICFLRFFPKHFLVPLE